MTVFGGVDSTFFNFTNAVWVLTNANGQGGTPEWINVIPEGAVGSPSARFSTSAVYDQGNNRMIIFGGRPSFSADANDTWVLTGANGLGGSAGSNYHQRIRLKGVLLMARPSIPYRTA